MIFDQQDDLEDPIKKWEVIYKKESRLLYGYLVKKVGDELAGDILQESFLKLLQIMQKGRIIENQKAYVFQIARNLLILEYKKNAQLKVEGELRTLVEDNRFDPVQGMMKKEFLSILESAKKKLPEKELEIFNLRWFYGLTQKEIAQIMKKSERQIRRDIEKIVNKLRNIFESAGWKENEINTNE
ncbi:MAG: sigma-70 family RNA polymerase sigma factor [Spirochaetia bacterium]|nr:sigma-70 family RNA polymerase sigma factor [Spirochaetia bacterium]